MQENRNVRTRTNSQGRKKVNNNAVAVKKVNSGEKAKRNLSANRSSNLHAVRAPHIVNIKKEDKAPFPWSVVIVAALFTGLFLFMMMNYAEVDKYRSEIADLDKQIKTLEKTQNDLEVTLDNKYDLKEVAKYATEELGMTSEKKYNYITIEQEDRTEMYNYNDGEEGGFGFLLTGFGEVLSDFIN